MIVGVGLQGANPANAPAMRMVAAVDGLQIGDPWITATVPGATQSAGYLVLRNASAQPDRLIGARAEGARRVTLHATRVAQGLVQMRALTAVDLPAGAEVRLDRGGTHLMFEGVARPYVAGDAIVVTLRLEKRGDFDVLFLVQRGDVHPSH